MCLPPTEKIRLVDRSVVTDMTILNVLLWGVTWLGMSLGNMSLRSMGLWDMARLVVVVLRRIFFNMVLFATFPDFVKGSCEGVEETAINVNCFR